MHSLTVIVPVLNDDAALARLLRWLDQQSLAAIIVDGAQSSLPICSPHHHVLSQPSRGGQIAEGVRRAQSQWIWVLHADSKPSDATVEYLTQIMAERMPVWGRFNIQLRGFPWLAWFMNWRSRLTKICTGDQGMFFHKDLLDSIGGYPDIPLMEDIEVSSRLKHRYSQEFRASPLVVEASTRRWRRRGVIITILSMWTFRLRYYFGAQPKVLARQYYDS